MLLAAAALMIPPTDFRRRPLLAYGTGMLGVCLLACIVSTRLMATKSNLALAVNMFGVRPSIEQDKFVETSSAGLQAKTT